MRLEETNGIVGPLREGLRNRRDFGTFEMVQAGTAGIMGPLRDNLRNRRDFRTFTPRPSRAPGSRGNAFPPPRAVQGVKPPAGRVVAMKGSAPWHNEQRYVKAGRRPPLTERALMDKNYEAYERPEMVVVKLTDQDVITFSPEVSDDPMGDEKNWTGYY